MIGVFDSGSGGLTVLAALVARLPNYSFLYLGDHAHAPYGTKSAERVYELTCQNVERLFQAGCNLVLLACNTASAVALRRLQQDWLPGAHPDKRVLGVLVPLVEAVTQVPWHIKGPQRANKKQPKTVGIFATPSTVASGAYPYEIGLRAPGIHVVQEACKGLVERIEENAVSATIRLLLSEYAEKLLAHNEGTPPDAVVLGCTHYPLVGDEFEAVLPESIDILQQPDIVAASFEDYLARHPEFSQSGPAHLRFLTTGQPAEVNRQASRFFGQDITFEAA